MDKIPIAKPYLGPEEETAVAEVLRSGWVTQGPMVAAFEQEFAAFVGAPYACAVSSGTTAMHLSLLAAGVKPGDEVVTVSHSYIATANVVRHCGAVPVFVDILPGSFNMNPALLEAVISPRTRAILCVHQLGMPCDLPAICAVASAHGLPVIEDAACAAGSEIRAEESGAWERIGKPHGKVACFSFHPRKVITTGDGGMITTADQALDARFRLLRAHSMSVPAVAKHSSGRVISEEYPELGYNYRLTDIQAAMGRVQLERLPELVERRRAQVRRYGELLSHEAGLVLPADSTWSRTNWQSYCVRLPHGADQAEVMQHLLNAGVSSRSGVMCSHREPAYGPGGEPWTCGEEWESCGCAPGSCRRLSQSELAQDRCLMLPLFHTMTEQEQGRVADALSSAL